MKKIIITILAVLCFFIFCDISFAQFGNMIGFGMPMLPYIKKTAAPTMNDYNFGKPFLWFDETNKKLYMIVDNTPGAAVWQELGSGSIGGADIDITGYWEVQDDIDFGFGSSGEWKFNYDDSVDHQLILTTTKTAAGSTSDPLFLYLLPNTLTINQRAFGIARGTQSSNTRLFDVDAEGDIYIAGFVSSVGAMYVKAGTVSDVGVAKNGESNTGFCWPMDDINTIAAGGVAAQHIGEYSNGSTRSFTIFNPSQLDTVTDATVSGDTLSKTGENFNTTIKTAAQNNGVNVWVYISDGTTAANKGWHQVETVTSDTVLTLYDTLTGTDTDVDFLVFSARSQIFDAGKNMSYLGGIAANEPWTFSYTTEGDLTNPLPSSVILLAGDDDSDNDVIDLQNGTVVGQTVEFVAYSGIDADDTFTLDTSTHTTCTNCPAIVLNKINENVALRWLGTTWYVRWLRNDL